MSHARPSYTVHDFVVPKEACSAECAGVQVRKHEYPATGICAQIVRRADEALLATNDLAVLPRVNVTEQQN